MYNQSVCTAPCVPLGDNPRVSLARAARLEHLLFQLGNCLALLEDRVAGLGELRLQLRYLLSTCRDGSKRRSG